MKRLREPSRMDAAGKLGRMKRGNVQRVGYNILDAKDKAHCGEKDEESAWSTCQVWEGSVSTHQRT